MKLPATEDISDGPNLTPVIDIVFLLLIFFLVASQFAEEEKEIDTRLPKVVKARALTSGVKPFYVNIDRKGGFKLEGKQYTAEQLLSQLTKEKTANPNLQRVVIRCDERATFKYPARVMGICEDLKMKHSFEVIEAPK
jgi:biopolymer transport protein ExbD